jgi:hypothetical protein
MCTVWFQNERTIPFRIHCELTISRHLYGVVLAPLPHINAAPLRDLYKEGPT